MTDLLCKLCNIDATSGDEDAVRSFIISEIKGFCDYRVDNLGNIIAFKKGKKPALRKVMVDARNERQIRHILDQSSILSWKVAANHARV